MLPAFTGLMPCVMSALKAWLIPRICLVDEHQRNKTFKNIYSVGVCVAIPPVEATPLPGWHPKNRLYDRINGDCHRA